jgi:uncharacterized damage-inducible protein DinB
MENSPRLALALERSREAFMKAALDVPAYLRTKRPGTEEWSVLEVVAHMADVDDHWLKQALLIRNDPDHLFVPFDDARWKADHPSILDTPWLNMIRTVEASHHAVLAALSRMTDGELAGPGRHPRGIPYTVRDVFLRYPTHDENHTRQVREILKQIAK